MSKLAPADPPGYFGGAHIADRLLSCFAGLPRTCHVRSCRRHKRCFGPGAICLDRNEALVALRMERHSGQIDAHRPANSQARYRDASPAAPAATGEDRLRRLIDALAER